MKHCDTCQMGLRSPYFTFCPFGIFEWSICFLFNISALSPKPLNCWSLRGRGGSEATQDTVKRAGGRKKSCHSLNELHSFKMKSRFFHTQTFLSKSLPSSQSWDKHTHTQRKKHKRREKKERKNKKRSEIASLMHPACCPKPFPLPAPSGRPFYQAKGHLSQDH